MGTRQSKHGRAESLYRITNDIPKANGASGAGTATSRERVAGPSAGARLALAFDEIERFPAPVALRDRAAGIAATQPFDADAFASACGGDLGLTLAVVRTGSRAAGRAEAVATVRAAASVLGPEGVRTVLDSVDTFDPLLFGEADDLSMQRARAHALHVRNVAVEVAALAGGEDSEEVSAAALMHDLGRLVVKRLHPEYEPELDFATLTPEKRLRRERRRYGIDHTLVGGVLARRWDLPEWLASAIERHHRQDCSGIAAIVGVADQIAHHQAGDAVALDSLRRVAAEIGIDEGDLRRVLSGPELSEDSIRTGLPCPLSGREIDALTLLSEGKVYKQIAEDMQVSVSTIRSHLHSVYGKLDVVDRAQAVLKARECGWI